MVHSLPKWFDKWASILELAMSQEILEAPATIW
jgi:hypothetical protein